MKRKPELVSIGICCEFEFNLELVIIVKMS